MFISAWHSGESFRYIGADSDEDIINTDIQRINNMFEATSIKNFGLLIIWILQPNSTAHVKVSKILNMHFTTYQEQVQKWGVTDRGETLSCVTSAYGYILKLVQDDCFKVN